MSYAEDTIVPEERSRYEIETLVQKHGGKEFGYMSSAKEAVIVFRMDGYSVRFRVPLPDPDSNEFQLTPTGRRRRNLEVMTDAYYQERRRRWRSLALVIKAKLEAIGTGITTFQEEFLAHFILEGGRTVGEEIVPQLEAAKQTGKLPRALLNL